MKIISQNIINYGIQVSDDTILRINLAWCSSVKQLKAILEVHKNNSIFLDLPIKRIKPPNNALRNFRFFSVNARQTDFKI